MNTSDIDREWSGRDGGRTTPLALALLIIAGMLWSGCATKTAPVTDPTAVVATPTPNPLIEIAKSIVLDLYPGISDPLAVARQCVVYIGSRQKMLECVDGILQGKTPAPPSTPRPSVPTSCPACDDLGVNPSPGAIQQCRCEHGCDICQKQPGQVCFGDQAGGPCTGCEAPAPCPPGTSGSRWGLNPCDFRCTADAPAPTPSPAPRPTSGPRWSTRLDHINGFGGCNPCFDGAGNVVACNRGTVCRGDRTAHYAMPGYDLVPKGSGCNDAVNGPCRPGCDTPDDPGCQRECARCHTDNPISPCGHSPSCDDHIVCPRVFVGCGCDSLSKEQCTGWDALMPAPGSRLTWSGAVSCSDINGFAFECSGTPGAAYTICAEPWPDAKTADGRPIPGGVKACVSGLF